MSRKSTIKLLLVNESDNESERLISLFRNAGRVARAHRVTSADDLFAALENDSWDLLIANDKHPEIQVEDCLQQIKKQHISIPSIVLRDTDAQALLEAGASDVIAIEDDTRLVFAAVRELQHLENFRKLSQLEEKLADAEQRCDMLMEKSQEAIAYVADGMLISANPLFCSRFGYDDPDDLDCSPVIDLIDADDRDKFKGLLKTQLASEEGSTNFSFTGIMHGGSTFDGAMQLSNAVMDDEPCIQLTIGDQLSGGADTAGTSPDHDPATGLYSHDYFISQLDSYAKQAAAGSGMCSLLYIGIDKYTTFRSRYGITHAYNILLDIAAFIQAQTEDGLCLAHFCDDSFTLLLPDVGAEKATAYAEKLCSDLKQHITEVSGQSIQCTASIGVLVLDNQSSSDPNTLVDAAFASCEKVRSEANNDGVGDGISVYVPVREKKSAGSANNDEELDAVIEEAIDDGQLSLLFQPVVSLRGTSGDHYEVQTIITQDDGEQLTINEFLAKHQFQDVNTRIDRWIIIEATKQLAKQLDSGHDTRLFINLTSQSLQDESLITWLSVALKAGGIPAEAIIFQFSETDIIDYLKPASAFAESINSMGCKLSINDFGESDDPVKTLKHISADYTKFCQELTTPLHNGEDIQPLKAMVSSINENDAQGIISGVENAAVLAVLWQIGIDFIQGEYMAAPSTEMNYEFTDIA